MSNIIKLINDKFENDFGFLEGVSEHNLEEVITKIKELSCQHQPKIIYSWGIKKESVNINCDLIFDISLFFTKIKDTCKLSSLTGLDLEIKNGILGHPRFLELLERVIEEIEHHQPLSISFICNHGKHRSVGWVEIMKTYFFKNSEVKHLHLK
jgi:RNase adaptor protein for sRNA GlmZ degradation